MFNANDWIGRTFRCRSTGQTVTLTAEMVRPRAFISIGDGFIDLGDGYYSRRGGDIEELTNMKEDE